MKFFFFFLNFDLTYDIFLHKVSVYILAKKEKRKR